MRVKDNFKEPIKGMIDDVRILKQAQYLGSDSLVGYLTHSSNLYDLTTVLVTTGTTKKYRLTFLNDTAINGAISKLSFFWAIDHTDVMGYYVPPWASGPMISCKLQKELPVGDKSTWVFSLTNNDMLGSSHTAYIKVFFTGTDSGVFSFVQI